MDLLSAAPLDRLEPTEELSDLLAEVFDLGATVRAGLIQCLRTLDHRSGLIWLRAPAEADWNSPVVHRLDPDWAEQAADPASPLLQVARQVADSGNSWPADAALALAGAAPLLSGSRSWGAVLVAGAPLEADQARYLVAAGRALGRAIQTRQLQPAYGEHGPEQTALQKIAATLTSTLQLDEILTFTVEGIRQLLNVETASLVLRDDERGELIFKKTLGGGPDWIFQYSLQLDRGLIGECIATQQPLLVNDAPGDPRFDAALDGVVGVETRSVLCAPLLARGQVLGAIELINKRDGCFSRLDEDVLVSMGASVANALNNSLLFHQITVANAALEASRFELLSSRSTLQALFDGITAPIYIVDRDYRLVAANISSAQHAGAVPTDLVGQICHVVLHGQAAICAGCPLVETWSRGQGAQAFQRRWARGDNPLTATPMDWETNSYPIRNDNGQLTQAIVMSRDVTEKRRLEASLAQAEKLAALGQLAAGVAHEINNPLAAILANAQLLQREFPDGDDRRESIDLIATAGKRASRVVGDLLDFARQEHYSASPTDVNGTICNAVALIQHDLHIRSIALEQDLSPNLPVVAAGDDHLQGVWLNLLMNARDAVMPGQGQIRVSSRRAGGSIVVSISDNGMGIPEDLLTRIFEPFFTTKDPGRGTGLGLSVCHRIIRQHGGDIQVLSAPGRGATFVVTLPIHPATPL